MLGPYAIVSPLGAGGMGEVYRARDPKLNRDVAIKVVPEVFASDPERMARFEREAQLLASLNHPHIAQIYGFEAGHALVMELVEGETLADRLGHGPVRIDEALAIGRQIAEALDAAHEQGIIHRDLKPANIKVTPAGVVKVLDFGLAKLAVDGPDSASRTASMSPTMLSPAMMTGVGVLLGTAAYMSPEQARGRPVDRRTDIWAFGCVLYEMLAGCRIFPEGETISDAVAAVLTHDPDWQALPTSTPWQVTRVLRRCLQRDPRQRPHHIADVRLEIEEAIAGGGIPTGVSAVVGTVNRPALALPWVVAVFALAVASWALLFRGAGPPADVLTRRLQITIPPGVELSTSSSRAISIAPDGSRIAFVGVLAGSREVYLRRIDRFEALPVRGSDGAMMSFFSPDGQSLAMVTTAGVLRAGLLTEGSVGTITDGVSFSYGGTWLPDGRIVFVRKGTLWAVPRAGGTPQSLTTLDAAKSETFHGWPLALPGGKTLLLAVASGELWHIDALSLASGTRRTIVERGTLPMYSRGHLLFLRDGDLLAAPFDADQVAITGPAVAASERVGNAGTTMPIVDVSATGTLVYASTTAVNNLVWVSRDGSEQPLNDMARNYTSPRFNHKGDRLLIQAGGVWIADLERATFTRLAARDAMNNAFPIWTADEKQVVYRTATGLRVESVDGSAAAHAIAGTSEFDYATAVANDGETMVFLRSSQDTSFDIYAASLHSAERPRTVVKTAAYEGGARLSPDSHWLTYVSNDSGQNEVYLRPFPGPDRRWQISGGGGTQPVWNPNGRKSSTGRATR